MTPCARIARWPASTWQLVSADLKEGAKPPAQAHPIEILARAYGLA
ncbi:MAG: hypothetical protein WDM85_17180 [Caulobacteraceae bacterium]